MSETPHNVSAPGLPGVAVYETGINHFPERQQQREQQPQQGFREDGGQAPTMADSQARAVEALATMRARAADPTMDHKTRDALMRDMSALSKYAFGIGPKPAFFDANATDNSAATDGSEFDGMGQELKALKQPVGEHAMQRLRDSAVQRGLSPELADNVSTVMSHLDLPEQLAKQVLDRVLKHHGATVHDAAEGELYVLQDQAEIDEFAHEAARLVGGFEKLDAMTERARRFLEHKGVLEVLDKHGVTRSSLALDPRVLQALNFAADLAGVE